MKTLKEQQYHQRRCKYCEGTGLDIFNQQKPCPNCSKEPILVKYETCPSCERKFFDNDNMEIIKELGMCLSCDHIYYEVLLEQYENIES